ncbi:MAG: hypothetical protein P4L49_02280 [Desulfosporosinus sp.]|nr:hypothetical protein [Desulfosporosinus sp.]
MDFLKKIFSKDTTTENKDTTSEQSQTVANDYPEDVLKSSPENLQSEPTLGNLRSKFFRTQKSSFVEPPETLHENEAWAPARESVGLFRKRRLNAQEHSSNSARLQ